MSAERELRLLRFYLGADCYSMETTDVTAIRRWEETGAPAHEGEGVIASLAQGPVYSLRGLLGLEAPAATAGPVFVVRTASRTYGVQVDRVARAVQVPRTLPKQLPAAARDPLGRIRGVVRLREELSLVLSPGRLPGGFAVEEAFGAPAAWAKNPPPPANKKLFCFTERGADTSTLFAVALRQVVEIAEGLPVIRLGGYNPCVYGITDWRGYVVPVVVPSALLGVRQEEEFASGTKLVIMRGTRSRELFALRAANFAALTLPLGASVGLGKPIKGLGPYVRAAYECAGGCMVLPDLDLVAG
jgi:chemotaxis signal transduction protein